MAPDFSVFSLFARLWIRVRAHLSQCGLMYSITAAIRASRVALNDVNDKNGNDGDVNALSAVLTDPGCRTAL